MIARLYIVAICCSHDYISIVIEYGSVGLPDTFVILLNSDESLI